MTSSQRTQARQRQRIRRLVAEERRVPLNEVPYPRSNELYYWYLYETGEISRHQYEILIYQNYNRYNPIRWDNIIFSDNQRYFNLTITANNERLVYQIDQEMNYSCINVIPIQENLISYIDMYFINENRRNRNTPVTHERIMRRYGERLSESNNSLCQECLMPINFGEILCEECHQEV